jgi:hypothetical protein
MSVRDSLNQKPVTQAEVDALMANEPDVLPAYGGAGSMMTHLKRAKRQYTPTDARARLTAAERAAFAEQNAEPIYTSPEERVQIEAKLAEAMKRHDFKEYFANQVRNNAPLEDAWRRSKIEGDCPFFDGVERDGDPTGAPEAQILAAWKAFAESPIFAVYYITDKNSPRGKVLGKVMDVLYIFMSTNLVNMTLAQSWATCFQLLQNIGVLPAPILTEAQLQAVENSKPASDGNPVVLHDNGPNKGKPVTYVAKDGKTIRYSAQMLEQLTSRGYEMVMGMARIDPQAVRPAPIVKVNAAGEPMEPGDYRTKSVGGTGYTQAELDAMDSEKYRVVMQLSRNTRAMQPAKGL